MEFVVGAIILWVVPIFVAYAIGKAKRRAGVLYGLFLGWIGVIIVALLAPRPELTLERLEKMRTTSNPKWYEDRKAELLANQVYRQCPFCKEDMRRDATVCPHCRNESPAWTLHEGHWWSNVDGVWHRWDELAGTWERVETTATEGSATT